MAENPLSGDDTDSAEHWDDCWTALEQLPGGRLPTAAIYAEAARIINSGRAVTEGRGIEHIEERARAAHRLAADRQAAGSDEQLNRFIVVLDGALSALRRVPRDMAPGSPP
jgi:hypothetical protein